MIKYFKQSSRYKNNIILNKNSNDISIDIAKGIGIILVMAGHLNFPFWSINLIYFFHMPLFVFISGILHKQFNKNSLFIYLKKIFLSYLFFGFIFLIIDIIRNKNFEFQKIIDILFVFPADLFKVNFAGILWFLIALFIIKLFVYLFKINFLVLLFTFFLYFIVIFISNLYNISNLPFSISQALILILFYYLGFYYKIFQVYIKNYYIVFLSIIFIIFSSYSIYNYGGLNIKITNYHNLIVFNPVLELILAIS